MEEITLGGLSIRVREATRPGTASEDALSSSSSHSSLPDLPSRSLPGYGHIQAHVVEVAAYYCVMGCAFVTEGEDGVLNFIASAGPDLGGVAQDEREKGDRGLFRHHTGRQAPVLIEDLSETDYFWEDPLVQEAPHLRLYVGAPVRRDDRSHVGILAIFDDKPRNRKRFGYKELLFLEDKAYEIAKLI